MTQELKLYETVEALAIVNAWIEEHADDLLASGGELSPELSALLDQAEGDFATKVERVALKVRSMEVTADAIKAEEVRLAQKRRVQENAVASLKSYLREALRLAGQTKVVGTLATVSVQKNPPSVQGLLDEESLVGMYAIQSPFVKREVSYALDKKAVIEAHKAGQEIPQGVSVSQSLSLRIR